jgi:hypothetical protein
MKVTGNRKQKLSPLGEQINLLHLEPEPQKKGPGNINQTIDSSVNPQKQDELVSLSQKLAATKKRITLLEEQLEKARIRNHKTQLVSLEDLVDKLPALILFEVLKTASLKETKEVIKPLKPTAGMAISTNRSVKEIGARIGLSPTRAEKALQLLLKVGFVKQRGLATFELGQFYQGKKGRILPSWHMDLNNPEHIMLLFPHPSKIR